MQIDFDESEQPSRTYKSIVKMIKNSGLKDTIKEKSIRAFTILGEAESKIHGIELDKIHFHEVGAIDSIIDLIGSIIGFDYLAPDRIYTSAIPMGSGFANTMHGTMPVPSPAALEILKNYPVENRNAGFELTTPTGATLVKTISHGTMPEQFIYTPTNIGFGAGTKSTKKWPNVLRLIIGESDSDLQYESLYMIETHMDDLNPEIYPYLMEKIINSGAKDVFLTQIIMKKGRPGTKISVLMDSDKTNQIEQILFKETTTIGIRKYPIQRSILGRREKTVDTRFGKIKVKIIEIDDQEYIRPEFEECKRLALKNNLSIQQIYREIESMNK